MPAGFTSPDGVVLKIEDARVYFTKKRLFEEGQTIKAVDGVSLDVGRGEILALVGESGSGKTTLGRAAIGLTAPTGGKIILIDGEGEQDVGAAKGRAWKRLRRKLQMIFQDPFASIDPNMRVYDALRIPLEAQGVKRGEIPGKISEVMKRVGLPEQVLANYVFQLSGGQRQRIGIARVLLFDPVLVVADEPVSMLDASLKGDILHIIENESKQNRVAFLFITHDMAVAKVVAQRIAVMYLGKVVETGKAEAVVLDPLHPYTKAMLQASPQLDPSVKDKIKEVNIIGEMAVSTSHPPGCKFHPRCPYAMPVCKDTEPQLKEIKPDHFTACWLY